MHVCESANAHLLVPHELDGNRCEAITNTANEFALRDLSFHSLAQSESLFSQDKHTCLQNLESKSLPKVAGLTLKLAAFRLSITSDNARKPAGPI